MGIVGKNGIGIYLLIVKLSVIRGAFGMNIGAVGGCRMLLFNFLDGIIIIAPDLELEFFRNIVGNVQTTNDPLGIICFGLLVDNPIGVGLMVICYEPILLI